VGGGELRWLDLYTDAERADGASPRSGWGWADVAIAPDGKTLVGVLDWFVESPGPQLRIVASTDGGATWVERGVIDKPHYSALFEGLVMKASEWHLTVQLEDCAGCGVPAGETVYVSTDGGHTWAR
jgi:hypothetical protein